MTKKEIRYRISYLNELAWSMMGNPSWQPVQEIEDEITRLIKLLDEIEE